MAINYRQYNQAKFYNPFDPDTQSLYKILFLKEGWFLDGKTFTDKKAAVSYLLNYLHTAETKSCRSLEELAEFRKSYGPHLFEIVEEE